MAVRALGARAVSVRGRGVRARAIRGRGSRPPCLWAPGTSLSELLPDDAAGIVPWDEDRSAERALALMRDPGARQRNLEAIRAAAEPLTWDATAAELVELYEATADARAVHDCLRISRRH